MDFRPIYTLDPKHLDMLHLLYQQEWWTKERTLEETQRVVSGSQVCVGLVDEHQQLIGFARVLTDYTFKALIFDVIVERKCRDLGLGDRLMALILGHPDLKAVRSFELYCLPELEPFYGRYGFSGDTGGIRLMRRI